MQQNEEMKQELQEIINNMQQYVADVQGRADKQKQEYSALLREREELLQRMQDLEEDAEKMAAQERELSLLHQVQTAFNLTVISL